MNLHGSATWVRKDVRNPFSFEGLHENVGTLSGFVRSKTGNESFGFFGLGNFLGSGNDIGYGETTALPVNVRVGEMEGWWGGLVGVMGGREGGSREEGGGFGGGRR